MRGNSELFIVNTSERNLGAVKVKLSGKEVKEVREMAWD